MIRGIVKSVVEGVIKRFSATGRVDEDIDNREYFQHYGYTSRPQPGAELIIIREGNQIIAIASDDRRYRLAIEEGEAALYTDEGDKIHLKRGRIIEITGGEQVVVNTKIATVTASTSASVTAPIVTVAASTKVTITSPLAEFSTNVTIGGTLQVASIQSAGALNLQAPGGISAQTAGAINLTGATVGVTETGA